MEAMIVLSKEETSPKLKKLEKKVLQVLEEHNIVSSNGGMATEISFVVNMEEKELKDVVKVIEKFGKEEGFTTEVIQQ